MEDQTKAPAPAAAPQPRDNSPASGYPVTLGIEYPAAQSRILALFSIPFFLLRIILIIPHAIILYFVQIVALIAAWLNMWVILFTGKSSQGMYKFVVGTLRWGLRVNAYVMGLTDKYPPFKLDD